LPRTLFSDRKAMACGLASAHRLSAPRPRTGSTFATLESCESALVGSKNINAFRRGASMPVRTVFSVFTLFRTFPLLACLMRAQGFADGR